MKNRILFSILLMPIIFSCKNKQENKPLDHGVNIENHTLVHQKEKKHWTYEGETGPEHWIEIEKESECDGKRQSPINIIDIDVQDDNLLKPLDTHYSRNVKIHEVTNNGHTIQYNFEKGDFILLNNEKYELRQIHFHEASEHTINGIRYPLEMHLVHINKDNKIAVLAVLAKEGVSSEPFTFLEKYLPVKNGETKLINSKFDLNLSLPKSKDYYTYSGSLTTPPCTQNVAWFIYKTPITISVGQVKELQKLLPINNYRNEQSINGRIVKQYSSS
ncbi:carbonic anhydrase family protein [Arenibacter sp. F20364]|uniref:carbonic anhydrase n=1 Tax=Arenibacter sp. F20364 TaxID=2926415 RepID=UPI001FF2A4DD|nr:carbonic anhydrase family protein [Arenibacter sp. F20364]MCK0192502.1 carbonic anhydrase family protein [Arenibacter sp. F20364]